MNREINEFARGYQSALGDLLRALEESGIPGVLDWLANNTNDSERTDAAIRRWDGTLVLMPEPILTTGDVKILTAALHDWLRLDDKRYTEEAYGMLLLRLAKAGNATPEHEKSANPEENR